jgi:hypothetical protein
MSEHKPPAASAVPDPVHEGESPGHEAKGHHKKKGGGHGDGHNEEHGGGHGGSWIVTYSDMITLLMALFICIITFSSKEPEKYGKKRDSVLHGLGGDGSAGQTASGLDKDGYVWRQRPLSARLGLPGSEMPPTYSDPSQEATAEVLRSLEGPTLGRLGDRFALEASLDSLFESDKRLSPSGKLLLQALGRSLRSLPYEIYFEMSDARYVAQGVVMAQFVVENAAIHPSRLGVGIRAGGEPWRGSVAMVLARRP